MTLILELPKDLEVALSYEAAQLGLPLPEYALRLLYWRQTAEKPLQSGADLIAYWQEVEVIGTRPDIEDSQAYARQLRSQAETRERHGAS